MTDPRRPGDRREDYVQSREGEAIANMLGGLERRIDDTQDQLSATISRAISQAMDGRMLSDDERQWARLAIKREAQTIAFRQSVIDKTLTGLVWVLIVGLGVLVKEYLAAHGWKP